MGTTPKILRKWVKDEKRIITLLYQKGLLPNFGSLYWESYRRTGKTYKSKKGYKWSIYLPEMHYCVTDYWGEADEYSIVREYIDGLYWAGHEPPLFGENGEIKTPEKFTPKPLNRKQLIKHLQQLPTVKKDSKINYILNRSNTA